MRKTLKILLIGMMSVSLVGCVGVDASLHKALKKTKGITAKETETNISFELGQEGIDEQLGVVINQVAEILNSLGLRVTTKEVGNEGKTKESAEVGITLKYQGIEVPFKSWAETDLEKPTIKTIVQIPKELLNLLGVEEGQAPYEGKEYIILDTEKAQEVSGEVAEEMKLQIEIQKEVQEELEPKIREYVQVMMGELKIQGKVIEKLEDKEVDGEKQRVYKVTISDETLKEIITDIIEYITENKATKELIEEYIDVYTKAVKDVYGEDASKEELEEHTEAVKEIKENIEEKLKEIKAKYDTNKETYKGVTILGKEGISVVYKVSKEGYIVAEEGVVDFKINLGELGTIEEKETQDLKGTINLKIRYNTKTTNINNKELKVELPETTEENTIDLLEMVNTQIEEYVGYEEYEYEIDLEGQDK